MVLKKTTNYKKQIDMTLKEFFDLLAENPIFLLAYFSLIPFTALLAGFMGKGEGHISPWKYLYSALIYLACVPGIFAITLNIYLFLFEKQSIFDADVYTQILPILSMVITLLLAKNNVALEQIPGFGKMSGLFMIIFSVLVIMWILDRTRIFVVAFSYMPFYYVIFIFVALVVAMRVGVSRVFK